MAWASAFVAHAQFPAPVEQQDFGSGLGGWTGSPDLFLDGSAGHQTWPGAARNLGSGTHRFISPCFRVDDLTTHPNLPEFEMAASIRASVAATADLQLQYFDQPDCTDPDESLSHIYFLVADGWQRVFRDTGLYLLDSNRSVRLVLSVTADEGGFFSSFLDDVELVGKGAVQLLENPRFWDDTESWELLWGDALQHVGDAGDWSPGFARVIGEYDALASMRQCVDLTGVPAGRLHVSAAIRTDYAATVAGIFVDTFPTSDCSGPNGALQFEGPIAPGSWNRLAYGFYPPPGSGSLLVIPMVFGPPVGGLTDFDDVNLFVEPTLFYDGFEAGNVSYWSSVVGD